MKTCVGFDIKFMFSWTFRHWGWGSRYWPSLHLGCLHWWWGRFYAYEVNPAEGPEWRAERYPQPESYMAIRVAMIQHKVSKERRLEYIQEHPPCLLCGLGAPVKGRE